MFARGETQALVTVTGKGDQQWHHETVTVEDAVLRQGGIKGADFALVNTDAKDDIFSLIEVHRGEPELPALRPPAEVRAFDGKRVQITGFMNPIQFDRKDDLARYPCDLDQDARLAREAGVDAIYAPKAEAM